MSRKSCVTRPSMIQALPTREVETIDAKLNRAR
jgi:hypothetical protein